MTDQSPPLTATIQTYADLLTQEGISFELGEDGAVLMLIGESEAGRCEGYLLVDEIEAARDDDDHGVHLAFCEVFYLLPLERVPDERLPALMELILRLNESHRIGAWELHLEEREVRFRIYQTLAADQPASEAQLLMPLYEGVRAIDLHWSSFQMVLEQDMDPAHAIAEFYAREALDDEDGVDEELLARAGQLFEVARARYLRANHDAHARLITQRLDDITLKAGLSVLKAVPFGFAARRLNPSGGWNLDN
jgi:hypothetical protein